MPFVHNVQHFDKREEVNKSSVFISSPKPDFLWDGAKVFTHKCTYNREVTFKR